MMAGDKVKAKEPLYCKTAVTELHHKDILMLIYVNMKHLAYII